MSTLSWIIAASLLGSLLSVCAAGFFAYLARPHWVPRLVSFAVGALLAAVFLEMLPHALGEHHHGEPAAHAVSGSAWGEAHVGHLDDGHGHPLSDTAPRPTPTASVGAVSVTLLLGILLFFVLEKLVIWRHCHHGDCEAHDAAHAHHDAGHAHGDHQHDHARQRAAGTMIMVGDTLHNFLDGAVIAAAFMADTTVGIATALAIIAHEIPQEVGDFVVLLHSGYSKTKALLFNLLSSLAALAGGLIAYYALQLVQTIQPYILALGAASMIYVAIADLIPGLHRRTRLSDTAQQVALIGAGVILIALPHYFVPH
ncbi:ZIP family metal transporter [Chitiniphilus purpureus]|uniref:ZIP family metal transporter n=1 Tax=Chitiniphilus purpureus TaxID=2981137 RepID=A0ABY6DRY6_9NEIS|nr:ZIP family metal transporter [Chitiniphilus sp. CD1]UXY17127.1 ZIP family metal transporter [Chitiniphilus sp. CD1]